MSTTVSSSIPVSPSAVQAQQRPNTAIEHLNREISYAAAESEGPIVAKITRDVGYGNALDEQIELAASYLAKGWFTHVSFDMIGHELEMTTQVSDQPPASFSSADAAQRFKISGRLDAYFKDGFTERLTKTLSEAAARYASAT